MPADGASESDGGLDDDTMNTESNNVAGLNADAGDGFAGWDV